MSRLSGSPGRREGRRERRHWHERKKERTAFKDRTRCKQGASGPPSSQGCRGNEHSFANPVWGWSTEIRPALEFLRAVTLWCGKLLRGGSKASRWYSVGETGLYFLEGTFPSQVVHPATCLARRRSLSCPLQKQRLSFIAYSARLPNRELKGVKANGLALVSVL